MPRPCPTATATACEGSACEGSGSACTYTPPAPSEAPSGGGGDPAGAASAGAGPTGAMLVREGSACARCACSCTRTQDEPKHSMLTMSPSIPCSFEGTACSATNSGSSAAAVLDAVVLSCVHTHADFSLEQRNDGSYYCFEHSSFPLAAHLSLRGGVGCCCCRQRAATVR